MPADALLSCTTPATFSLPPVVETMRPPTKRLGALVAPTLSNASMYTGSPKTRRLTSRKSGLAPAPCVQGVEKFVVQVAEIKEKLAIGPMRGIPAAWEKFPATSTNDSSRRSKRPKMSVAKRRARTTPPVTPPRPLVASRSVLVATRLQPGAPALGSISMATTLFTAPEEKEPPA